MNFDAQYKNYFPSIKKAENNLKIHYIQNFSKNDKEISDTKINSYNLNERLLGNIREIKAALLDRIYKSENPNIS